MREGKTGLERDHEQNVAFELELNEGAERQLLYIIRACYVDV
jgi:hypothetical protein